MTASVAGVRQASAVATTRKRADIQGLRALAVMLVVAYHFFPGTITGGFVGVDVFFVLSGYLITYLLLNEQERTGTISLVAFYGRRIRRLLPAAVATTAATLVASWFIVDPVRLTSILHDASWAGAYLANVHFSLQPDGYFAAAEASPLLHTWSLAVEEQYYLLWPALLIGLALLGRGRPRRAAHAVSWIVVAVSLTASISLTGAGSPHAFYSLGTRAWELAIGGVVASAVASGTLVCRRTASSAVWVGLVAILAAAFAYNETTAFPGYAAVLPTVGTALVIWGGAHPPTIAGRLVGIRAVQAIGDASYSLYLWHWPVLILGTEVIGASRLDRIALVCLAMALGFASFRYVERPTAQLGREWAPRKFLACGVVVTICAVTIPAVAASHVSVAGGSDIEALQSVTAEASVAQNVIVVRRDPAPNAPTEVPSNVTPSINDLPDDLAAVFTNGCYSNRVVVCRGGDPAGTVRVVLTGDSHAGQWWPGLDQAARSHGWQLYMIGKNACPLADVRVSRTEDPECDRWQREALQAVTALNADVIVYDNHAQGYLLKEGQARGFEDRWARGVRPVLQELTRRSTVVAFGQTPSFDWDPATCLGGHLSDVAACSADPDALRLPSILKLNRDLARETGALFFDPSLILCGDLCTLMDANRIVYRDSTHVSASYSLVLADSLGSVVEAALTQPAAPQ